MADVVAVHRLVVGSEDARQVIQPGTRFDPGASGVDAETLERLKKSGAVREPRDENAKPGRAKGGPREDSRQGKVVEDRSGRVAEVTSVRADRDDPHGLVGEAEPQPPAQESQDTGSSGSRRRRESRDEL